ncbi:hypothetical protein [Bordetella ansorpii]|nr:hypothetical protein [Bordetella ansorpii]
MTMSLWLCAPGELPPHDGKKKSLAGPLFDLASLQKLLAAGALDLANDSHFYVATDDCWADMKALKWVPARHLRQALMLLVPKPRKDQGDYLNSQWAEDSDGNWHPCDAYAICLDESNEDVFVRAKGAPQTYIKFSIDQSGCVCLFLLSCHASS